MFYKNFKIIPFNKYKKYEFKLSKKIFQSECKFIKGIVDIKQLSNTTISEIAIIGRSNVGKSSLINALINNKILARVSNTPGRTRELNFFNLNKYLQIVDMPGYGYSKNSKIKTLSSTILIYKYICKRIQLKRVFILIDSRHGIKPIDNKIMKIFDLYAISYQIILTKLDKILINSQKKLLIKTQNIISKHPACYPFILPTSSKKKWGLIELRIEITRLI